MNARLCSGLSERPQDVAAIPTRARKAVADDAPQFASQIDAARALRDRLNRDVVSDHDPNHTPVAA